MIRIDCEQGSPEWYAARIGIPTASQFHRLLTPAKLEPSKQMDDYVAEKVAEWMLGVSLDDDLTAYMERGQALEPEAISYYEGQYEVDVERAGFLLEDGQKFGCSPDGLVGERGGLELKCPKPATHMGYLLYGPPTKYNLQIQGNLLVSDRDWWDFLSYCPGLPPVVERHARDMKVIAALRTALDEFGIKFTNAKAKLLAQGYRPAGELLLAHPAGEMAATA